MERLRSVLFSLVCLAVPLISFGQDATAYINAGNQFYQAKDYAKAAQYFQAATQLDPNSAAAYQGLGNCRYQSGDKAAALQAYEKALAIAPGNSALASFVQNLRVQVGATAPAAAEPASSSSYSATPASASSPKSFTLDVLAGLAIGTGQGSSTGFGGGVRGLVPLGQGLHIGGALSAYMFSSSTSVTFGPASNTTETSSLNFEILGAGKYVFQAGEGSIEPYAVAGVGMLMGMNSGKTTYKNPPNPDVVNEIPSSTGSNFMLQGGGGAAFKMGPDMKLFAEAKVSLVIGNGTSTYLPVNVGASFSF